MKNEIDKVNELSIYIRAAGDCQEYNNPKFSEKLIEAASWLDELVDHMCGQGYIGCHGGTDCSSDHK